MNSLEVDQTYPKSKSKSWDRTGCPGGWKPLSAPSHLGFDVFSLDGSWWVSLNDQLSLITKNNRDIGISLKFIPKFSWFWKAFWDTLLQTKGGHLSYPFNFHLHVGALPCLGARLLTGFLRKEGLIKWRFSAGTRHITVGFLAGSSSPVGSTHPEGIPLIWSDFPTQSYQKHPKPDTE